MDKGGDATPPMSGFSNAKGHINKQQSQSQSASSWRRNLTPLSTGNSFTTHFPFYTRFPISYPSHHHSKSNKSITQLYVF